MAEKGKFAQLYEELRAGGISRREFLQRATALGIGLPVAQFVLRSVPSAGAAPRVPNSGWGVAAQEGASRPTAGTEGKTRGQDGELRLIQWQAPTQISPHVSTGTKDYLAASIVLEPLMSYLPDGTLIPTLVKEVPTIENGLLAEDLTSVTYNLLEGVLWSDGEPFTAEDVVFTWQWVTNPENASVSAETYRPITNIEAVDELTVRVTFGAPNAVWYEPHAGTVWGSVYPKHVLDTDDPEGAHAAFLQKPIGTGPYVVDQFSPGDQVIYVANENYREENKPIFATVNLKGGGDAASAARAVLQTGDYDHAWNLQVEPAILRDLAEGGTGRLVVAPGNSVERININFSDPNEEVEGQRSYWKNPHPFQSDPAVRQAMNLAADRATIAEQFYFGEEGEPATANILTGIPALESPNTSWEFNTERGNEILEQAGWTRNGDVREKDGVQLKITYATSINPVRQKTQAVVKQGLEEMGFQVQLQQVDSGIFFDGSPGNTQNIGHFYTDIQMYTNNPSTPTPVSYMLGWYAGPDGRNIAQASNQWNGQNNIRYNNPEYDRLFDEVRLETDLERAAQLFIQMNDILINDVAIIPLVNRAADKYAQAADLFHGDQDNVAVSPYETNYWNIQNWNRASE